MVQYSLVATLTITREFGELQYLLCPLKLAMNRPAADWLAWVMTYCSMQHSETHQTEGLAPRISNS